MRLADELDAAQGKPWRELLRKIGPHLPALLRALEAHINADAPGTYDDLCQQYRALLEAADGR